MNAPPSNPLLPETLATIKAALRWVVLFGFCINLLMLTVPLFMLQVYDRVLTSRSLETLLMLTLVAAFALSALAALDAVRTLVLIRIGRWFEQRLSGTLLAGSVEAALKSAAGPSVQGLRDLTLVRTFLTGPGLFPLMDAPWAFIYLGVIFLLHPLLGWLSLAGAVLLFLLALLNERMTRAPLQEANLAAINALSHAEAAVRNADVIEAMGMMPNLVRRWYAKNAHALDLQSLASRRSGSLTALSKWIRMLLQMGILAVGAWLVIKARLTPGAMIAASILMGRALSPVEQAIGGWKSLVSARQGYQRLQRILHATAPRGLSMPLPAPTGAIDVQGVAFLHPGGGKPAVRNISFHLDAGESLAIIGPTASGKTTLARLLVGNLRPRSGQVRLDGMDVAHWEPEDRGRHIGYLPQDVELFAASVAENIARLGEVDGEAVVQAARMAGVHEMILSLPEGYETQIGAGGAALSGGQRQRVALARAVHGSPRFIVLDEPNANLDSEGEAALQKALGNITASGATVIIISHRTGVVRQVDKMLVLQEGLVQHFGPREEVLAKMAASPPPLPPTAVPPTAVPPAPVNWTA